MGETLGVPELYEQELHQEQLRLQNEMGEMMHRLTRQYEKEQGLITAEKRAEFAPASEAEIWLRNLADFIVIANGKTWAADGAEVNPRRPGYKRLQWPYPDEKMTDRDWKDYNGWEDWRLEDEYTGYFRAPGMTTIYYKDKPAWTMSYGGHGQTEGYEGQAKQTFNFLKSALTKVTPELPFRGPEKYEEGDNVYSFKMLEGDITDGLWKEEITESGVLTFRQTGIVGLVIHRDADRKPLLPWKL